MPPNPPLLQLVIDEDLNWHVAGELRRRGIDATSIRELEWADQGLKDGELIKRLAERGVPCVLVTFDNKMPLSHCGQLDFFSTTLAVIDNRADRGDLSGEQYYRDVIHRHAHRMATQGVGTRFRYSRTRRTAI